MSESTGQSNLRIACAFIDELATRGIQHAVISPGSRSTPLAVALAKHPAISIHVLIDERSAAFFALGMARQLGEPVACLCTSGTAAANYAPAVIEASLSRAPLIVLTADRPPELRDWGASQTIDQIHLFGSHAKWFTEMPVPEDSATLYRHARATAARAAQTASMPPAGPVHINAPFREPLLPPEMLSDEQIVDLFLVGTRNVRDEPGASGTLSLSEAVLAELTDQLAGTPRGLIVCGPGTEPGLAAAVAGLARVCRYPVLADPLSSLRFGTHDRANVVSAYDVFLRDPGITGRLAPDLVLRLGAQPTSKPLQQYLTANPGRRHVLLDPGPPRDPFHLATSHIAASATDSILRITKNLGNSPTQAKQPWLAHWRDLDASTRSAISTHILEFDEFFEGRIVSEAADLLPEGATLVVGNSMPVRDVDTFVHGGDRNLRLVGTRGASGIDGVVSAAIGAATVTTDPVIAIVGDLSFFHDMNGLHAGRCVATSCTIVVINNNGGGIFSFLPQANLLDTATFEALFGTPVDLSIERTAALYGATYTRPANWGGLREALLRSMASEGVAIVEVVTDRSKNLSQHRAFSARVLERLRSQYQNEVRDA